MFIRKLLQQNFIAQPTEQQEQVFDLLSQFLSAFDTRSCFVLKGYAGTGKTSIISALTKTLPALRMRSVLLAPTGRAAKVISDYSGKQAFTIHKKIYRKKNAAHVDLDFKLAENMHENTLFVIDEASMIADDAVSFFSASLLDDLISYVQSGKSCSLMFVGDTAQLPPVGMLESPSLNTAYLTTKYGLHTFGFELTDVIRQKKLSGILYNATTIRQDIQQEEDITYTFPKLVTKGYSDVFKMTGERLIEGLHYCYDQYGLENTIVICRSNKSANLYNQHIRNQILFRDDEITGGDLIMVVRNNYYWLQQDNPERVGFIANGDMASVQKVTNVHEQYGFRFADLVLEFSDAEGTPIMCRAILESLHTEGPNLPYEKLKDLYSSIEKDYEHIPKKKDRLDAIKNDPYFNALQLKFAYAVTCHKAQGGQWPVVFVDQGYLNDDMLNTEFMRWLYTAVTRATQQLFLVNFDEKFFNH